MNTDFLGQLGVPNGSNQRPAQQRTNAAARVDDVKLLLRRAKPGSGSSRPRTTFREQGLRHDGVCLHEDARQWRITWNGRRTRLQKVGTAFLQVSRPSSRATAGDAAARSLGP
jgi:hypothetical protein